MKLLCQAGSQRWWLPMVQITSWHHQKGPQVWGLSQSLEGFCREEPACFEWREIFLPTHKEKVLQNALKAVKLLSWEFLPRFEFFLLKIRSTFLWPWNHDGTVHTSKGFKTHLKKKVHLIITFAVCKATHL